MFKMKKVFDCQAMPYNVRDAFFSCFELGNDCYVSIGVSAEYLLEAEEWAKDRLVVLDWLYANGADTSDESVIISHCW